MSLTKVIAGMADDSVYEANKNVIINGNFDLWQRGTSFTSPVNGSYAADRFRHAFAGAGVFDVLRSTSVPNNTSDFSLQVDVTTADASIAAGDIYLIQYRVEGFDAQRFGFGASDAQELTLSFWARSAKTGVHCVSFRNSGGSRSYVDEYTINVADTWEFKSISLTADTTGTWLTDTSAGIIIDWALAAGSTFQTTAGSWQAGNFIATSNQVNVMDNTANNFHLSRVQLELGSSATAFERRSIAQELSMAQRYYAKSYSQATVPGTVGSISTFDSALKSFGTPALFQPTWIIELPVTMRAAPTFTAFNPFTGASGTARDDAGANLAVGNTGINDRYINAFATRVSGSNHYVHYTADAEL